MGCLGVCSYKCFYRCTFFSFTFTVWTDRVGFNMFRNDERFGIMDNERFETFVRAFNDRFTPFHQVQYVHAAIGVMCNGFGKPMPSCFDELALMKAGIFFFPAIAFGNGMDGVDQFLFCLLRRSAPVENFCTAIDIDRAWFAIKSHTTPIP